MAMLPEHVVRRIYNTRDENIVDLTASFYELEPFDSIVQALAWRQIKRRVPLCMKKTLRNRFTLPNIIYVWYTIGLLIIDFNEHFNSPLNSTSNISTIRTSIMDQPVENNPVENQLYIVLAIVNIVMGFLYCWAWRDRSLFDIVMIPEYVNLIQAGLYLWSATWYPKQDTLGGYYTMAVHKIELTASIIGLFAVIGWIVSWYMTYTRILGRGYTLDDPDLISCLAMVANSVIYVVYNIQINVSLEQYQANMLYKYGDVVDFVNSWFCIFASLRDDDWFWFLPVAGQYGIALGRVEIEAKILPQFGKTPILLTTTCFGQAAIIICCQRSGLDLNSDLSLKCDDIIAYKLQWFNGAWTDWYVPGVNDMHQKVNLKNNLRRMWLYFYDHTHTYIICNTNPNNPIKGC